MERGTALYVQLKPIFVMSKMPANKSVKQDADENTFIYKKNSQRFMLVQTSSPWIPNQTLTASGRWAFNPLGIPVNCREYQSKGWVIQSSHVLNGGSESYVLTKDDI